MANVIGCKQANYSAIERNCRELNQYQLNRLIEHFGEETINKYTTDEISEQKQDAIKSKSNSSNSNINNNTNNIKLPSHGNTNDSSREFSQLMELFKEQQKQTSELIKQNQALISHNNVLLELVINEKRNQNDASRSD